MFFKRFFFNFEVFCFFFETSKSESESLSGSHCLSESELKWDSVSL